MKFLIVGDPHGDRKVFKIKVSKDIDAILITGDLGQADLVREYHFKYNIERGIKNWKEIISKKLLIKMYSEMINSSIKVVKYFYSKKQTFFVFGNLMENRKEFSKGMNKKYNIQLPIFEDKIKNVKSLKNISFRLVNFRGIKIAGVPYFVERAWVKRFSSSDPEKLKLAKKSEKKAKEFFRKLQKVDILLSHIPPFEILDKVGGTAPKSWIGKHAGSLLLLDYIKKKQPKYVVCGHIHEAKGNKKIGKTTVINAGSNGDNQTIEVL